MTAKAFVALVTCFNDDETLNLDATRAQVRRQVDAGNNIMCAGTNGDFTALTFDEKVALTEAVVDEVAGRAQVIVNAGMPATFETLKLAREFDRIGVDGMLTAVSGEEPAVVLTARPTVDALFRVLREGPLALGATLRIEGDVMLAQALGDQQLAHLAR
mgnify:CR=1 FL=1